MNSFKDNIARLVVVAVARAASCTADGEDFKTDEANGDPEPDLNKVNIVESIIKFLSDFLLVHICVLIGALVD